MDSPARILDLEDSRNRLDPLVRHSIEVFSEKTIEGLLQKLADAARELVGGRVSIARYGLVGGRFNFGAISCAANLHSKPSMKAVDAQPSDFHLALLNQAGTIRLTDAQLRRHPAQTAAPEHHVALRGLLGARLAGRHAKANGLILVTDRARGEFTKKDEAVLKQLGVIGSLALLHLADLSKAEHRARKAEDGGQGLGELIDPLTEGITIAATPNTIVRIVSKHALERKGSTFPMTQGIPLQECHGTWELRHTDGVTRAEPDALPLTRAIRNGEIVIEEEWVLWRSTGASIPVLCNAAPMRDSQGQITGGVITWRDITARKGIEAELRQLNAELEQRILERTAQLRALAVELTRTEERERYRLALGIRDDLQQILVSAKLCAEFLHKRIRSKASRQTIKVLAGLLNEAIESGKAMTLDLSPPVLYEEGLAPALQWLGDWMLVKHGLTVRIEADGQAEPENEDIRVFLFQAVRELLVNAVLHAGVTTARVRLSRAGGDQVQIVVSDEGAGFDPAKQTKHKTIAGGLGLFSIRERLELLGGRMEVKSKPGQGSCITLAVPKGIR